MKLTAELDKIGSVRTSNYMQVRTGTNAPSTSILFQTSSDLMPENTSSRRHAVTTYPVAYIEDANLSSATIHAIPSWRRATIPTSKSEPTIDVHAWQ